MATVIIRDVVYNLVYDAKSESSYSEFYYYVDEIENFDDWKIKPNWIEIGEEYAVIDSYWLKEEELL
jgi:hypothetical protein